jgi:hypothetical protein
VVAEVTRKGIYINVRLTGFHPSPTSHAVVGFRFLGRLTRGPAVRATHRRHSLRLDVLTIDTKCAYAAQARGSASPSNAAIWMLVAVVRPSRTATSIHIALLGPP